MDDQGAARLIFVGAEAEVRESAYLGRATVQKRRVAKNYRRGDLDERIRRERTKAEAALLAEAGAAGVPVPRVLDIDLHHSILEIEAVTGEQLRVILERDGPDAADLCRAFGAVVGRLHGAGIVHGDLTTSNVIVRGGRPVLIDFGLAQRSEELEDRGVDLHLVERTYESTHPGHTPLFDAFMQGYRSSFPQAEAALARMEDIKARGRYV